MEYRDSARVRELLAQENIPLQLYSGAEVFADPSNIRTLIEAIDEHRQVILHGYQSAHGGEVRDRRVEPFAFTTNYVQVWCYDPEAHACKLFKTSRIGSAELTEAPWEHEPEHREGFIDAFRTAACAAAYGWSWDCWPTTCSARSTRWPSATSGRWAGDAGCWTPKWRDSPG